MKFITEREAMLLPGRIEVISERRYPRSGAINRMKGQMPEDLLPGGVKIIIELERLPGQRGKKHLCGWWVKGGAS
tara:strand:+ start:42 stop:266 length:225 start_codon:yes stop_codon:yes gene_type:complete